MDAETFGAGWSSRTRIDRDPLRELCRYGFCISDSQSKAFDEVVGASENERNKKYDRTPRRSLKSAWRYPANVPAFLWPLSLPLSKTVLLALMSSAASRAEIDRGCSHTTSTQSVIQALAHSEGPSFAKNLNYKALQACAIDSILL